MQEPTPAAAAVPPWRQAGVPKAPLPDPPQLYKGNQKLRHNKGYHANRGGTQRDWFNAKYGGFKNYQLDPHMRGKPVPPVALYPTARTKPGWNRRGPEQEGPAPEAKAP